MSLQEQIDEAWKELSSEMEVATTRDRDIFEAGYRAALASLYVEVKPEDVLACTDYITFENGKWWNRWWFSHEWALEQAANCEKIYVLQTPSPSSVFGGGA